MHDFNGMQQRYSAQQRCDYNRKSHTVLDRRASDVQGLWRLSNLAPSAMKYGVTWDAHGSPRDAPKLFDTALGFPLGQPWSPWSPLGFPTHPHAIPFARLILPWVSSGAR